MKTMYGKLSDCDSTMERLVFNLTREKAKEYGIVRVESGMLLCALIDISSELRKSLRDCGIKPNKFIEVYKGTKGFDKEFANSNETAKMTPEVTAMIKACSFVNSNDISAFAANAIESYFYSNKESNEIFKVLDIMEVSKDTVFSACKELKAGNKPSDIDYDVISEYMYKECLKLRSSVLTEADSDYIKSVVELDSRYTVKLARLCYANSIDIGFQLTESQAEEFEALEANSSDEKVDEARSTLSKAVETVRENIEEKAAAELISAVDIGALDSDADYIGDRGIVRTIRTALYRMNSKSIVVSSSNGTGTSYLMREVLRECGNNTVMIDVASINGNIIEEKLSKFMRIATSKGMNTKHVIGLIEDVDSVIKRSKVENNASVIFDYIDYMANGEYGHHSNISVIVVANSSSTIAAIKKSKLGRNAIFVEHKEKSLADSTKIVEERVAESNSQCEKVGIPFISDEITKEAIKLANVYITTYKLPKSAILAIDYAQSIAAYDNSDVRMCDLVEAVSKMSGVDIMDIRLNAKQTMVAVEKALRENVINQDTAIDEVMKHIKRSAANLGVKNKPKGSLMFLGQSGVGKTEMCRVLAAQSTDTKMHFIKIDMSEFMESHSVSKLIGSPPGYIDSNTGGRLTNEVRQYPNSLVLFDEIEKAHPKIADIFLQILEDGCLTDSLGEAVSFKDCIVVFTSNAYTGKEKKQLGFGSKESSVNNDEVIEELKKYFKVEFINRIDSIVTFNKLDAESCVKIAELGLEKLSRRMAETDFNVRFSKELAEHICEVGFSLEFGARNINRAIQNVVETELADLIINEELVKDTGYLITYKDEKLVYEVVKNGN